MVKGLGLGMTGGEEGRSGGEKGEMVEEVERGREGKRGKRGNVYVLAQRTGELFGCLRGGGRKMGCERWKRRI